MMVFPEPRKATWSVRLAAICAVVIVVVIPWPIAHAQTAQRELVLYRPPSGSIIIDGFRPPSHIGAAGNRGLQYAPDGDVVIAAADGWVFFAGPIGDQNYITLAHGDGLRTTYSFLADIFVAEGQTVTSGMGIGLTGPAGLHFGAYAGSHYLDPEVLFAASDAPRRLVLAPPP